MDIVEAHMSANDIFVILHVCEKLHEAALDGLDIVAVANSLKSVEVISSEKHQRLLKHCEEISKTPKPRETSINQFYSFLRTVSDYIPFFGFCAALNNAGYTSLSEDLIAERLKHGAAISRGVLKRELPNARIIHRYYTHLKRCADNNFFENQTSSVFSKMVASLGSEICHCPDSNRLQLLVDKRCVLYLLLCQQSPCVSKRNEVLKQMRESMPRNVDRTIFDTIFHSYMAFNWAISGDAETAEKHEKQARVACNSCVVGFVYIIMAQWSQYKNNILYLKSDCREKFYFNRAKSSFELIQQCLEDVSDNEAINMWKTISVLDMARSTAGIHAKFEVCDISKIDEINIEYAHKMLGLLTGQKDIRRMVYYLVIRGRLFEMLDRSQAMKYVEEAVELAGDGCYDNIEKINIKMYLQSLERGEL